MPGLSCGVSLSRLAESFKRSLEGGHVDLAIVLDDVDVDAISIGELSDLLGSLGPAHLVGFALEGLDEDDSLVGCHVEAIGKCFIVECVAPLIVDVLTPLHRIID